MPCICRRQSACGYFQNSQPHSNEHISAVVLTEVIIYKAEYLRRSTSHQGPFRDQYVGDHHKQRTRNTLAGYISHEKRQMIIIDEEEVVKVELKGSWFEVRFCSLVAVNIRVRERR